jgi:hypothetical protein
MFAQKFVMFCHVNRTIADALGRRRGSASKSSSQAAGIESDGSLRQQPQFFLMRQNDRADLDDMARDIGLTELTKHAILSYPLPDQQTGEKFAAFTYLHNDAQNPICGTAHNLVSPEMLYISGSSGAQFDERARQLRATDDIVFAIEAATSGA